MPRREIKKLNPEMHPKRIFPLDWKGCSLALLELLAMHVPRQQIIRLTIGKWRERVVLQNPKLCELLKMGVNDDKGIFQRA
jgi:hypothetical protein